MNIQGEDNTFDIRIFFPNGAAVQALVENDSTANDLIRLMIKHLEIDDYSAGEEALAIWFVSPLLEIQLKPCQIPYKIYQKWPAFLTRFTNAEDHEILLDEPLLVLRRNVLLTLDREIQLISKYEKLAEVLYFDARDKYLSGRYSVDIESSLELVGLQLAIGFGPCNGNYNKMIDLI
uniref:FERM domain-containing protein 8 n=1 Tax=Meloidogyne hapla TaxID=6305 RepID=A0A1I8BF93_MELHA